MGCCAGSLEQTVNETNREQNDQQHSKTMLNQLPLELLDVILISAFLQWILNSTPQPGNQDVINTLASVDFCWFQRITTERLKQRIWQRLKDFYIKTKKRYTIIRNIQNYLDKNIRSNDELLESLLSFDCLSEEQSHLIQRQRSTQDKNAKLLYFVKSFDETKFSNFVRCLRRTNQKTVARIIEEGGGVIKVEMQNRGELSMEIQLLHQTIEDLRNRAKPRSHQTDKVMSQLREEGIEILNSRLDRQTVVVWIWCHSQTAIENCQTLYESNRLKDVLFSLANIPETDQSKVINIDSNQFKKTVVVCQISTKFTRRIDVGKHEKACAVTKLRNEIYVLCLRTSVAHVIRVFEDHHPFCLQNKIVVKGSIERDNCHYISGNIVSSENQNCLYVCSEKDTSRYVLDDSSRSRKDSLDSVDLGLNYVWKITTEEENKHKVIKWLTFDYETLTLSMSSNGQLLVVIYSSPFLEIYGSDAELIRSIQLPRGMTHPLHAVETSIGNYIIIHDWIDEPREGKSMRVVSELTSDGQMIIHRFIPSNKTQKLTGPAYLSLDSDDRVFVADSVRDTVVLLESDLKWNRILCSTKEEKEGKKIPMPWRLCYDEEKKQLIVVGVIFGEINVYTLSWT